MKSATLPAREEGAGAVVFVHGRGASEYDLVGLAEALDPDRRFDWHFPRGPHEFDESGGAHWYAVAEVGRPDAETFAEGFSALAEFVDALGAERLVIGGFSQGAVMSYAVGLGRGQPRPAGVLALSGYIPEVSGFELDENAPFPPVAIGHGTRDQVIPVELARSARDRLETAGAQDLLYRESDIAHTVDPEFVPELSAWLQSLLG